MYAHGLNTLTPETDFDDAPVSTREQAPETVEVTYYPVLKNNALGRRMTRQIPARRGENPIKAAERELARRYKVRDYLILDAYLKQTGFLEKTEV